MLYPAELQARRLPKYWQYNHFPFTPSTLLGSFRRTDARCVPELSWTTAGNLKPRPCESLKLIRTATSSCDADASRHS